MYLCKYKPIIHPYMTLNYVGKVNTTENNYRIIKSPKINV